MRFAAVALLVVAALARDPQPLHLRLGSDVNAEELRATWESWKLEYDQKFTAEEEDAKFRIFAHNLQTITEHNAQPNITFTMGLNQFAALTNEEWKATFATCKHRKPQTDRTFNHMNVGSMNPSSVDWSEPAGKYVTPVKNQKQCGSCWAFSATGSLEARSAIAGKPLVSLSEQELIDCSRAEGDQGCNGGLMDDAFEYVKKAGGLCTEAEYPYTAKTGMRCKASQCQNKYDPIGAFTDVNKDSEMALETAVAAGPVSVAVEADQSAWQFYHGGVVEGICGKKLDHGVLIVGYGEAAGSKYWKVKNSWGETWGEAGYVRICRDCHKDQGHGECGILDDPSYPDPQ